MSVTSSEAQPGASARPVSLSAGAVVALAIAAILWLAVNGALVAFYCGDTGIGTGGDTGSLSAALNELLVFIGILLLWLVLSLPVLQAAWRQPPRGLALLIDLLLLGISYWAAIGAVERLTPSPMQALPIIDPAQFGVQFPPPWPQPPYAWPILATALVPPLWGALAILARRSVAPWALRGTILVVTGIVLAL
jgi:hypothetical protein